MRTTKRELELIYNERLARFGKIVTALGKTHRIVGMMGSLAWGRHAWETSPDQNTAVDIALACGALDGYFHALNMWARDNDHAAQRVMIDIWYKP